jgi:thiopeptide-type bacteriocin biosynthesis protein
VLPLAALAVSLLTGVASPVLDAMGPVGAKMTFSYQPTSQFILRTPLLPFQTLADAFSNIESLKRQLHDPTIFEAVFIASPHLADAAAVWCTSDEADAALECTLVRYLSRMAGRATPFGLFAGVAVATEGDRTLLEVAPRAQHRRHTRLDNDYLFSLCTQLADDPAVRAELQFSPNTSLYKVAGRWRYAEARTEGTDRRYHLVAVEATDYLDAVLVRASDGATLAELSGVLLADPGITREEADAFILTLVKRQLLLADLVPNVTGPEPVEIIIRLLSALPSAGGVATSLTDVHRLIAAIDAAPVGSPPTRYREIASALEALPVKVDLPRLFQVDLHVTTMSATVGPSVMTELARAADLLLRLGVEGEDPWIRFREAFTARYGTREVALVEALDEDVGIGFGDRGMSAQTPLIANLPFPKGFPLDRTTWSRREAHMLTLLGSALAGGATEIELSNADLNEIARATLQPLPDTFALKLHLVAESAQAIDEGRFLLNLDGIAGSSATRLLGRFCHGSSSITKLVADLVAAEERPYPDVVFAEVVHLPEGRIGNILLRPVIRDYEIPYLGKSGADPTRLLPITDLTVSIAPSGRIVLRSERLGKEVRPQLASAHNFAARGLAIYRFLCSVSMQDARGGSWSWGALSDAPFLPRVRYGKIVLAEARWLLRRAELEALDRVAKGAKTAKKAIEREEARDREFAALQTVRDARRLPRWVVVADGDNELPIDLDNPLSVTSFVHLVKNRPSVTLHELLPGPEHMCVCGEGGAYVHELIVPFVRSDQTPAAAIPMALPQRGRRRFPPGSSWLYAKLYGSISNLEVVLRDEIRPFVREVRDGGLADVFFFVRYSDPDLHIRLRFHGEPERLTGALLPSLAGRVERMVDAGLVWRMQIDTYEREVERYGGDLGVVLAEALFGVDSEAVLAIIDSYRGDDGAQARWRLAVVGVDRLLADLGLTIGERYALMTRVRDNFGAELGLRSEFQRRLGDTFRLYRGELRELLAASALDSSHPFASGLAVLQERSLRNAPIAATLREAIAAGKVSLPLVELVPSYVHMHVNRMQPAEPRRQEVVLYDLLRRHYEGVLARAKRAVVSVPGR